MADRNQWSGDRASTSHIPRTESETKRAARLMAAAYATDAGDLELLVAMLGLDHIEHLEG